MQGVIFLTVANCKQCGRIFNRVRRDICADCSAQEDRTLTVIRGYLKEHRDANIQEVSGGTEVEYDTIVRMIQDGRLLLRDNPNMTYPCERCGTSTTSGRFCANCSKELAQGFGDVRGALKAKNLATDKDKGGFFSR